ncbi:MAG: putative protease YhbU precursor [Alphaproteobacteria bacterium ADurb.Bin438]|nr:MAG: putative protease YhbU precursor [Alphaproteobacteria bacterium ADurb.Bin438]
MKCKLLSPAGDINSGYAAIEYGADEIYLGLKRFSARGLAHNFTPDELDIFTNFAKSKGKRVFLTLNTLVRQKDLKEVIEVLNIAKDAKVDGIIVQDFGIVNIINQYFKDDFEIHASTQMAIHNLDGAKAAEKLGIKRIVLARELSFDEIEHIVKNTTLETEVFIHGAMCYSYSGLCMFSALKNNLSGNMGLCTYSCREAFGDKLHFSMKDLWVGEDILKLQKIGVTSLKIEGRRKNPLYVGAVTDYYRKILDGKDAHKESDDLKVIFSRGNRPLETDKPIDKEHSGHKGLLIGKILSTTKDSFTFKTVRGFGKYDGLKIESDNLLELFGFPVKEIKVNGKKVNNVEKGDFVEVCFKDGEIKSKKIKKDDRVYLASDSKVKSSFSYEIPKESNFVSKIAIDVEIEVDDDLLIGKTEYSKAEIELSKIEPTKNPSIVYDNARKSFDKTKETSYVVRDIKIKNKGNIYVSVSDFNALRNELLNFEIAPTTHKEIEIEPLKIEASSDKVNWILKIDEEPSKYKGIIQMFNEVVVDIDTDFSFMDKDKVRIMIPTISRDGKAEKKAKDYYNQGYRKFMIDNIYGLSLLPKDADLKAYYNLYCLNQFAYFDSIPFTISPEDSEENIAELVEIFKDKAILPVIYNPPLFISGNKAFEEDYKDLGEYEYITKKDVYYVVEKQYKNRTEQLKKIDAKTRMIDLTFAKVDFKTIKDIMKNS